MTNQLDNYSQLRSIIISYLNEYRHQLEFMKTKKEELKKKTDLSKQEESIFTLDAVITDLEEILNNDYFGEPLRLEYDENCIIGEYV